MDISENVRQVEEMLASDSPPTDSLGETTDYRQMALAWAKAHDLTFEETIQRLRAEGGAEGQRLVADIERDPEVERLVRGGLSEPLAGDEPTVTDYTEPEYA